MNTQMIKGYKAFNHDLTCRDFQYQIGKTYNYDGDIEMCERGFHFCHEYPFDVLDCYPIIDDNGNMRRFARVSSPLSKTFSENRKTVTSTITIVEELSFHDLVDAQIRQILATSGDGAQVATIGNYAQVAVSSGHAQVIASGEHAQVVASGYGARVAASGYGVQVATSGYCAQIAASGYGVQVATSGNYAQVVASSEHAQVIASGEHAQVVASGYGARVAASGYRAQIAASGNYAQIAASDKNSVITISGRYGRFKGVNGTFVSCANFDYDGKCNGFVSGCVGKNGLKANVWYTVSNGKFVECEAQS